MGVGGCNVRERYLGLHICDDLVVGKLCERGVGVNKGVVDVHGDV